MRAHTPSLPGRVTSSARSRCSGTSRAPRPCRRGQTPASTPSTASTFSPRSPATSRPTRMRTPSRWRASSAAERRIAAMTPSGTSDGRPASELIDELGDWRGDTLARMRTLIKEEDPDVVEEWKWMGTPVWEHDGIICTGESYKKVVKLTFAKGASLSDPTGLFNSSLDGNVRRAIDIHEGGSVDESAFKALVREAVLLNTSKPSRKGRRAG